MIVKATMTVRNSDLVVPLAPLNTADATDMRTTDTAGQLALFGQADVEIRSGAISPLIGSVASPTGLRRGNVDSTNGPRTAPTTTTRGRRTSTMATRTTTTRTTSCPSSSSADESAARHADFSFEDLVRAYIDCRRSKRTSRSAREFEINQEVNLYQLYTELKDGTYRPGRSICFVIKRPKPREVWAALFRDRIVHHLLYNKIAERFHKSFIADSCACIPGRGTLYAAERLEHKIRSITRNWTRRAFYLKCDLASFFVSINKHVLRDLLARRIHEPWWFALAEQILFHDPRQDVDLKASAHDLSLIPPHKSLFNQPDHLGLPIGNLSSQFFANIYLDALDQHVKHRLHVRNYIRYVDDFILLHESPRQLNAWLADIVAFLPRELGVRLNPAKTILQPVTHGVDFVGQIINPWHRIPRRRTVHAALRRIRNLPRGGLVESANSYFGQFRQSTHSHGDRADLANVMRRRGHDVDHRLTKAYR